MRDGTRMSRREAARGRVLEVVGKALDRHIPLDESKPVRDETFWGWEELGDEFDREVTAAFMEELAGLSAGAALGEPGCCPFCTSGNTKWLNEQGQRERQSKHGPVVLPRQVARCRSCGRSLSPSGAAVVAGPAGGPDAGGAGGPGVGGAAL
jgi:hypothetical protein